MKNHGVRTLRGLTPNAIGNSSGAALSRGAATSTGGEGRFRRIFNRPPVVDTKDPLNLDPDDRNSILEEVGKPTGPMDGGTTPDPTSDFPLGMVYFGQFIDHDITLDATSELDEMLDPEAVMNFRTPALDLDNIYGFGPGVNPYLYDVNGQKLLTASEGSAYVQQPVNLKAHDLCRNAAGVAMIGDPRNDENRVISQLQLAFIRFHNAVMTKVINGDLEGLRRVDLGDGNDFKFAQRLVRWHYQWIINHEFLPLLCGQSLVDAILGNTALADKGRIIYDPNDLSDRAFIPIEFAVAAYRFGHSMIAQKVKISDSPLREESLFGQRLGHGFMPLGSSEGIMRWQHLFNINSSNFQRADRLDAKLASTLLNLPFIGTPPSSLATRNLMRGFTFDLATGEEVVQEMNNLLTTDITNILTPAEIAAASNNQLGMGSSFDGFTPLWFYILLEAEKFGNGETGPGQGLGPVGGRIVAETLIGIQEKDLTSYLCVDNAWEPNLISGSNSFSMADLLTYV